MKKTKEECLELGVKYIKNHNCYPASKKWTIKTAGCSRDRIYENWKSWTDFVEELRKRIRIPNNPYPASSPRKPVQKTSKCLICENPVYAKFCSNKCQALHRYKEKIEELKNGKFIGKPLKGHKGSWLRKFMIEHYGETCNSCGIGNNYNGKSLTLEIDHIDGKAYNNYLDNLRFLCPNCHSQTNTYKAKNKNSDRKNRYA